MAIGLEQISELYPIDGIRLATGCAGIKQQQKDDLAIIELCDEARTAAVFTRNAFCAAPVTIARKHLKNNPPRMFIINSGNANAGTGQQGIDDANACCESLARLTDCSLGEVLPFLRV